MYNPYQAPPYGRPPGFGAFPGQAPGAPPGMAPPGIGAAPGVGPAPGMQQAQAPQAGRGGGIPAGFQPPANMPNINFSAPVIRLGTSGPTKPSTPLAGAPVSRKDSSHDGPGARPGLGSGQNGTDQQRDRMRENMLSLIPPTRDEVARTIFIGGITDGAGGDEGIEKILRAAGQLKRWHRATDADEKKCSFGFAEYEDAESLETAVEILKDIQVPKRKRLADEAKEKESDIEKSTLLVVVDENSLDYIQQYNASRGTPDPATTQARLDSARENLASILSELSNPTTVVPNLASPNGRDGDTPMQDGEKTAGEGPAEVVMIPLTVDDELADIPAEMRDTVAQEIAAFRDRSNRRDLERLRREEEISSMERVRGGGQPRSSRLASPPLRAPLGPAGGANGVPLGPRDRTLEGAPSGPKGFQGHQVPRDYQKGVSFVNGSGINGAASAGWINRDEEDSDVSDSELERRRRDKRDAELEKFYLDQERRWLNRERSRTAAVEREKKRDQEDAAKEGRERDAVAKRLSEWNDDTEAARKTEEYYADRSMWIRNRASFRQRELELDERDAAAEQRELERSAAQRETARGMADAFLDRQSDVLQSSLSSRGAAPGSSAHAISSSAPAATGPAAPSAEPARFKLSLGAAAQRAAQANAGAARRTMAEVEGLLEDEEDGSATTKRTLVPITFDAAAEAASMTQEERDEAVRRLAAEIPSDRDGLWAWPVRWEFVDDAMLAEKLKPFVEKKIVEYLGVQEQMLVEVVEEHVRKRGQPGELVGELEGALDDEAEPLVRKLWRMMIFFSESEKRGFSA
ncbi:MAG: hypothetical protein M1825_003593 [Sarcosagium campestre]|nr:MAG: hypothetical protein M1825_003593 [Sarcosagium campestre]